MISFRFPINLIIIIALGGTIQKAQEFTDNLVMNIYSHMHVDNYILMCYSKGQIAHHIKIVHNS